MPHFDGVELVALRYIVKMLNDGNGYVCRTWQENELKPTGAEKRALAVL